MIRIWRTGPDTSIGQDKPSLFGLSSRIRWPHISSSSDNSPPVDITLQKYTPFHLHLNLLYHPHLNYPTPFIILWVSHQHLIKKSGKSMQFNSVVTELGIMNSQRRQKMKFTAKNNCSRALPRARYLSRSTFISFSLVKSSHRLRKPHLFLSQK